MIDRTKHTKADELTRRLFLGSGGIAFLGLARVGLQFLSRKTPKNQETWEVKKILSGQTLEAMRPGSNQRQKIRLLGISAPLLDQEPWGLDARKRLDELVKGKTISLERDVDERDNSDRLLGYVWIDQQMVNQILVKEGYVLAEIVLPNERYRSLLEQAQNEARLLGLGIWDPRNPMRNTPKEFFRLKQGKN